LKSKQEMDARSEMSDDISQILRLCRVVYSTLGPGHSEAVYQKALELELSLARIPFDSQRNVNIEYKGHTIGFVRLDILIHEPPLILELKSVPGPLGKWCSQWIKYARLLPGTDVLAINFGLSECSHIFMSAHSLIGTINKP
jgi:GxxExxY protein